MAFYQYFTSLVSISFLFISLTQCQTQLTQGEISKLLQIIQNQQAATNQNPAANNVETLQIINKLMASQQEQQQQQQQQQQFQPQPNPQTAPTQPNNKPANNLLLPLAATGAFDNPLAAIAASSFVGNNNVPASPVNNYLTARAFDFGDTATSMMLLNGLRKTQNPANVQPPTQTPQTTQPSQTTGQPQHRGGLFGQSPVGNYLTARVFDFPDFATNMFLFNGMAPLLGSPTPSQQAGQTQQQRNPNHHHSTFDPYLFAFTGGF